ncbi:hypothetical protein ACH4F6_20940 [Streptomyces sp. NPDC017936]|uniref:hypothetical protein n=1 Tax=Streptomyces sp. NPDC017936 TaxID=3365016 RepID=UPI0037A67283
MSTMDHRTPSQAEGERDDEDLRDTTEYPTPSQAEGERDDAAEEEVGGEEPGS